MLEIRVSSPQEKVIKHLPEYHYLSPCIIILHVTACGPLLEFVSEGHELFIFIFVPSRSDLPEQNQI